MCLFKSTHFLKLCSLFFLIDLYEFFICSGYKSIIGYIFCFFPPTLWFTFSKFIFFFFWLNPHGLWDLSSLTRNRTHSSESTRSQRLDCQGILSCHFHFFNNEKFLILMWSISSTCNILWLAFFFLMCWIQLIHKHFKASQVVIVVKNLPANAVRHKRCGFTPWVEKVPWSRAWQPDPVFLPGESHGQKSLVG